jgi:hypothetical protein
MGKRRLKLILDDSDTLEKFIATGWVVVGLYREVVNGEVVAYVWLQKDGLN